ncbi:MAG: DJ-1 family glyoxalase III [Pontiellaceae bacterium]
MQVLIPLASGCEEMEAVILIDVLRRAGWQVTTAALESSVIEASRGVRIVADQLWDEVEMDQQEALILPGGIAGTQQLCAHAGVQAALRQFSQEGRWVGSICAAALALHEADLLKGKRFTCYPGVEKELPEDVQPINECVVVDEKLITSQGPGTAFECALAWIEACESLDKASAIRRELLA